VLPVGPPVPREWQIGREGDIARLAKGLQQGDHTVLADMRRTGKTTVALGALDVLAEDECNAIIAVDLSRAIGDGAALDEAIALQVAAQQSGIAKTAMQAGSIAVRLWNLVRGAGVADGEEGDVIDAAVKDLRAAAAGDRQLGWALDAAVELAAGRGGRAFAFIDEAQLLDGWQDRDETAAALLARMRQPETPLTFLYAGSEPSMLRTLFADGGLLEYDALDFRLSPIDPQPWLEGLRRAFRELGMDINTHAIDRILEVTGGQPHRTMLAANRAHEQAAFAEETVVDDAIAEAGLRAARESRLWELDK
jgi:DNA polymerase III delta prime subunit